MSSQRALDLTAWRGLRPRILARDGYACQLRIPGVCTGHAEAVDHVIPKSLWPEGMHNESNLVAACGPCNRRKGAKLTGWRDPLEADGLDPYDL